jgi:2-phospho-L-lactate guanylyltransferase
MCKLIQPGLFAVVPIKEPRHGKSRLAHLLNDDARRALNIALARRTIEICVEVFSGAHTIVVTASEEVRAIAIGANAEVLQEPTVDSVPPLSALKSSESGLNAAIQAGMAFAVHRGASAVAIVPTDMPLISPNLVRQAVGALAGERSCTLVPDRRNSGTNLMVMTPPEPGLLEYGDESFSRHASRARELGFTVRIHRCERLGLDLDLPEDLRYLQEQRSWQIFASTTSMPSASPLASTRT